MWDNSGFINKQYEQYKAVGAVLAVQTGWAEWALQADFTRFSSASLGRISSIFYIEPPLTETNPAGICLLKSSGKYLLKRKAGVENAEECGEGDPVQVSQKSYVWLAPRDKTSVCEPYVDHPPDAVEEEGLEVGGVDQVPLEGKHLAPEQSLLWVFLLIWDNHNCETR